MRNLIALLFLAVNASAYTIQGNLVVTQNATVTSSVTASAFFGDASHVTGTAASLTAGNVTTNANLTGGVTSVGNAATVVTNANLTGNVTSVGNATTIVTVPTSAVNLSTITTAFTTKASSGTNADITSLTALTSITSVPTFTSSVTINSGFGVLYGQAVNNVVTSSGAVQYAIAIDSGVCSASTCTMTHATKNVTSITRVAPGTYQINFSVGAFSSWVACTCVALNNGAANNSVCTSASAAPTTSLWQVYTRDSSTEVSKDDGVTISCAGQ